MRIHTIRHVAVSFLSALVACKSAPPSTAATPSAQAAVDAVDRPEDDKKLDAGRHPAEILSFFGISPGMRVEEIFASTGYTSELLARAVGPSGTVYAENPAILPAFAKAALNARLEKSALKNVVVVERDLDDPIPPEAKELDAVLMIMNYHDAAAIDLNRAKMNAAVFLALKHGGEYGIVDHSAKPGAGTTNAASLHRIEESTVRTEIEHAGFRLEATADFLRNASDTRDWSAAGKAAGDKRGTSDRFVLKFVKP